MANESQDPSDAPAFDVLQTRNVCIDTSVFEQLSYGFSVGLLKYLREHSGINILLPDVIVREVRDHLSKAASESVSLHKTFSDKARILRTLGDDDFKGLFERFTIKDLERKLHAAFDQFIASATIVPVASASAEDVFNRYFAGEAPFATGKKKAEFPDAFALDSLRRWASDNDSMVYVISNDQGMKEYCDECTELIHVASLEGFLEMAVLSDEATASKVKELIDAKHEAFEDKIREDFPSLGFYIDELEGDVEHVAVQSVCIVDCPIVDFSDGVATVELDVQVEFQADVSYDDFENAFFDKETQAYFFLDRKSETWTRTFEGTCSATILIDEADPDGFSIEHFIINNGEDIALGLDDEWPE